MKTEGETASKMLPGSAAGWLAGIAFLLHATLLPGQVAAAEPVPFPGEKSEWNGYARYDFEVDDKPVLVVTPKTPAPGRPWVWHGEFFGHKPAPDLALLGKGFHIVYMRVPGMLGSPQAVQHWDAFYKELTTRYGFAKKSALVGLSRGGLYCYNWAAANPDKVACIYGDAPVCDFKSWPGGKGKGKGSPRDWKLVLETYGFRNEAQALAYDKNPIDNLEPLAKAGVPLLHVYGDADDVVPWDENTGVIAERYRKLGGSIALIAKPGVGHHPHGLDDSTPLVEFIAKHAAAVQSAQVVPVKKLILPGESFLVDGRPAFILWPPEEKRQKPQPWIMYAPTLPGLPDRHEKWMHEQFVSAGVAVAGIDIGEAYGSPAGQKHFTALYRELTGNRGFATKSCLLGRSRGGLWISSWAIRNTDKVAGIAGIYPVFDLRSYPGLNRAAPVYGLKPEELEATLDQHNPIAKIDVLAKAKVPVFIIHGDVDKVVPLKDNSAALIERYEQAKADDVVELVVAKGQGHNYWPGFFRCQELVDFAIRRAKSGSSSDQVGNKIPERRQFQAANALISKDVEYQKVGDKRLLLDLYRPKSFTGRLPVVLWVHGGGWKNGSKDRCPATWLVEHGYAVASINYRLTHEAQWPAQIDDCRAAVRWLRANAGKYQLDGDHMAAWGGSAGGHLVALLGTLDAPQDETTSSRVQAVCDWYGPTDLLTMPPNVLSQGRTLDDVANSNGAKLLGGTVRDRPELAKQASALYQVSKDDPPFLILHGEKDPGVPLVQSQRLHKTLTAAGVSSTLHVVEGAGHGGKAFHTPEVREIMLKFFGQHLRATK